MTSNVPLGTISEICQNCMARQHGLCSILCEMSASFLSPAGFRTRFRQGFEISSQGENLEKIGVVSSGLVKVAMMTEEGDEYLLQLLRPGQIVGSLCQTESAFSWEAATPTEICWVSRSALLAYLKENPRLYGAYLTAINQQLDEHRLWVASMRGRNSFQRIAYWLIWQLPDQYADQTPTIHVSLTRRDLASLLDMTVETLCRGFHQLEIRGAIEIRAPDVLAINSIQRLADFAGHPADDCVASAMASIPPGRVSKNPFRITGLISEERSSVGATQGEACC